jgi:hypothetical protein
MEPIKCITFDKNAQDALPEHIKTKMKADREKARANQKQKEIFTCKGCGHEIPKFFVMKNEGYCYMCDPDVTLEELLK